MNTEGHVLQGENRRQHILTFNFQTELPGVTSLALACQNVQILQNSV